MPSADRPSNSGLPRKRRRDRKPRLEVLGPLLDQLNWDDLQLADAAGVSAKTIARLRQGKYVRHANADLIEKALRQYTTAEIFHPANDIQQAQDTFGDADPFTPLQSLYRACAAAPVELRQSIRIHEFQQLVADRTSGFCGRQWLFAALDRFIAESTHGYFVLRGQPGVGKTSFAAAVAAQRGCVHHFISRFTRNNHLDQFLASICSQLIVAYKLPQASLPARATRDSGVLVELLTEIVRQRPNEKVLLLVDAADEAERPPGDLANVLSLPPRLPERCFVLLTTRDASTFLRLDSPCHDVYLDQSSPLNLDDVRLFLRQQASRKGIRTYLTKQRLKRDRFVELLEERSQGNFMYLKYVLPEIERGRYTDRNWRELPAGLVNYYESHWALLREGDRTAWFDHKLPILKILATAPEPVSLRLLCDRLPNLSRDLVREILLHDWRQFLERVTVRVSRKPVICWRLYHASFADFLRSKSMDPDEQLDLDRARDEWFTYGQAQGMVPD
jgi:hypothetical protein